MHKKGKGGEEEGEDKEEEETRVTDLSSIP